MCANIGTHFEAQARSPIKPYKCTTYQSKFCLAIPPPQKKTTHVRTHTFRRAHNTCKPHTNTHVPVLSSPFFVTFKRTVFSKCGALEWALRPARLTAGLSLRQSIIKPLALKELPLLDDVKHLAITTTCIRPLPTMITIRRTDGGRTVAEAQRPVLT